MLLSPLVLFGLTCDLLVQPFILCRNAFSDFVGSIIVTTVRSDQTVASLSLHHKFNLFKLFVLQILPLSALLGCFFGNDHDLHISALDKLIKLEFLLVCVHSLGHIHHSRPDSSHVMASRAGRLAGLYSLLCVQ